MAGARSRARGSTWAAALMLAAVSLEGVRAAPAGPSVGPPAQSPVAPPAASGAPPGGTLGLAVTGWRIAIYETPDAKECPQGLNVGQYANYLKQFPNDTARAAREIQFGYGYGNRGPNGEGVEYNPEVADDPIPFKLATGPTALGVNLDGKIGPNDFVGPDGETGVKNQLYRVLGCVEGFRSSGLISDRTYRETRDVMVNRLMFEVSGVDNLQNDPDVTVRSYRGLDPIAVNSADQPAPGATQHIDYDRGRRYMTETHGRIVNGVLITEPVDLRVPAVRNARNGLENGYTSEFTIRGMQLRVKLTPTGGQGYIAGYADLFSFWNWLSKTWGQGPVLEASSFSPPSTYKALRQMADGYPDEHGVNTAISMALSADFVTVRIEHGDAPASSTRIAASEVQGSSR